MYMDEVHEAKGHYRLRRKIGCTIMVDQAESELMNCIKNKRTAYGFQEKAVPRELIEETLEAARWGPSGANGQPWEFIVVQDPEIRDKLAEILRWQLDKVLNSYDPEFREKWLGGYKPWKKLTWIKQVPSLIAVCQDPRQLRSYPQIYDGSEEETLHMSMGAAVQNLMLRAYSLGLATNWQTIHAPTNYRIKDLLGVPDPLSIPLVTCMGFMKSAREKSRRRLEAMVHYDGYDASKARERYYISSARRMPF